VRLENQALGGPLAGVEAVGRVAEGNHWQWPLVTGNVEEAIMPAEMTDRIPHAAQAAGLFETLNDIGLLFTE
jgi:hypothetical protein